MSDHKLVIRRTNIKDTEGINKILKKTYSYDSPYTFDNIRAQLNHFPEGQVVVEYDGQVVGFCMSFIINEKEVLGAHTWE
mgnify:FL=1